MKKTLMIALLSLLISPAWAADTTAPHASHEKPFAEHKAEVLKRMEGHQEKMNQRKACVEAAQDAEALKACMPKRHANHHRPDPRPMAPETEPKPE